VTAAAAPTLLSDCGVGDTEGKEAAGTEAE
jgi:hypothetical protein